MDLKSELIRNAPGYFLVSVGIVCVGIGSHAKLDKFIECGAGLVSAGLLAFQAKHGAPTDPKDL